MLRWITRAPLPSSRIVTEKKSRQAARFSQKFYRCGRWHVTAAVKTMKTLPLPAHFAYYLCASSLLQTDGYFK